MRRYSIKRKNNLILGALAIVLITMAVGYSIFSSNLNIAGTSNISTTWDLKITNVEAKDIVGHATDDKDNPASFEDLTANFNALLYYEGDSITYYITVKNNGTLDAALTQNVEPQITSNSDKIKIETTGFSTKGEVLTKSGGENITKVKITYVGETALADTDNKIKPLSNNKTITPTPLDTETKPEASITITYPFSQDVESGAPSSEKQLVTYDCTTNGGTACPDYKEYVAKGNNVNLDKQATKDGYTFVGWNTDKDATTALETLQMNNENTTLYAIYSKTITVTYEKGVNVTEIGKYSDTCNMYNNDTTCSVTLPAITTTGTIDGWYNGDTKIGNPNDTYTPTENITLTAKATKELPIIKGWSDSSTWSSGDYHSDTYRTLIKSAEIVDLSEKPAPSGAPNNEASWDVSAAGDNSVIAWVEADTNNAGYYKLYIGGDGGVATGEDASRLFYQMTAMETLDISKLDTRKTTNMSYMFSGNTALLSLDVSNMDTSNVTNMSNMFYYCASLTNLDLSNFDTSKVENFSYTFAILKGLTTLNLSNLNTSSATLMYGMFQSCTSLTSLDLSSFDTSSVTSMYYMFYNCRSLTNLDLSSFDTSSVTSMFQMFYNCTSLISLDLSNLNTSSATSIYGMFKNCTSLITIYVSNKFVTTNVTSSSEMFYNCTNLIGGNGTTYSSSYIDATYAVIDTPSTPGYFTSYLQPKVTAQINTSTITLVVSMDQSHGNITKYEFSKNDGSSWVDNGINNIYTFTGLTQTTTYPIKVRVTKSSGETATTNTLNMVTKTLETPTYKQINNSTSSVDMIITYPKGCGSTYTCSYSKNSGSFETTTSTTQTVNFSSNGTLVAKVTDGTNIVTASSYTVTMPSPLSKYGITLGVASVGDGLYADSIESGKYIYKGAGPNNYICLGGSSNGTCPSNSLYRIISIESDGTLKVIKNASIGNIVWDPGYDTALTYNSSVTITTSNNVSGTRRQGTNTESYFCIDRNATANSSYDGCNAWGSATTTLNSSGGATSTMSSEIGGTAYTLPTYNSWINVYLNGGTYHAEAGTTSVTGWYDGRSTGLNSAAKNKVLSTKKFNIGPVDGYNSSYTLTNDRNQEASYQWQGKVGLMNITDFVAASSNSSCTSLYNYHLNPNCYNNSDTHNWLFLGFNEWTISPREHWSLRDIWYVNSSGNASSSYVRYVRAVRPVMFLSSSVQLSGSGTQSNPYVITN